MRQAVMSDNCSLTICCQFDTNCNECKSDAIYAVAHHMVIMCIKFNYTEIIWIKNVKKTSTPNASKKLIRKIKWLRNYINLRSLSHDYKIVSASEP